LTLALPLLLVLAGTAAQAPVPQAGIRWEKRFDEAMRKARSTRRPVMIDFWADWCNWCHRLDRTTYVDPVVVRKAEALVPVKVDTEESPREAEIAARYGVQSLPTILFLSPSGRIVMRVGGYQGPGVFPRTIDRALESAQRVMEWESALERNASDAEALASLGSHLFEQEEYQEAHELLLRSARLDEGLPAPIRRRTRMTLAIIENFGRQFGDAEVFIREALTLRPTAEDSARLLFILGRTYLSWGRREEARDTLQALVRDFPQSSVAPRARDTLLAIENQR
jgi:thioredoxin-like negative regulator of GroEL